tara:strand:- start:900 stop:1229 length:330 start_codon:yes stop_codon:yes gene_type:complete
MAHYSVIKSDSTIYKDQIVTFKCDMSGLPDDLWALQWDGTNGEIEYSGNEKPNLTISSESEIESALGVSLTTLIERRDTKIEEDKVEEAKAKEAREAAEEEAKKSPPPE